MNISEYECSFPPQYESEEWIWESKGYIVIDIVTRTDPPLRFRVTVRDPVRLEQDVKAEFEAGRRVFWEQNAIVVPRVSKSDILAAVDELARSGFEMLSPD